METGRKIRFIILFFIVLCVGGYLGIACYYMSGFSFGTWINGVYCTGKSVEEVNEELLSHVLTPELTVIYPMWDGEEVEEDQRKSSRFVLDDETVTADYTRALQQLLQRQRPLMWIRNLFMPSGGYELKPDIVLTEDGTEAFYRQLLADEIVQAELSREACIRLETGAESGLELYDGKKNRFDAERALSECVNAIKTGEDKILLTKACYYNEAPDATELEQEKLFNELQEFLDFEIVYDMGAEQVRFDRKALVNLLERKEAQETAETEKTQALPDKKEEKTAADRKEKTGEFEFARDDAGEFIWDDEKVTAAIEKLADVYDTYGKPRQFTMTGGGEITLEKGNYGTQLDKKTEIKWLSQALAERKSETHTPSYLREAYARGENDIGDTYIEINMTKQKLWFYQGGEVEIETPIVTGNMMRRRGTPEGVYYVYGKQKNRILRGPGYASHVNYWMPVKGGVGIHDALWRDEFGGDIYKKEGSHGCINLPLSAAEKLYGLIEIGVPVVMYYEEDT